jgi:hypothetical protein
VFQFVLHCFSSGRALAEAAIEMGGYISFSGILTFPKADELRAIAADMPLERLLVETDSPYLAPVPFRGKRNEPAHTVHTAKVLGEVKGLSPEAIAALTTTNFRQLYRFGGLAADRRRGWRRRLGGAGPARAAQPPHQAQHRDHDRNRAEPAGRYRPGSAVAADRLQNPEDRRGVLHPCACRPHRRAG